MFILKSKKLIRGAEGHVKAGLGIGADYVASYVDLLAPFDSKVRTYWGREGGNWIEFTRNDGVKVRVAHLNRYKVKTGEEVKEGTVVAITGNSGSITTGPHAHVECYDKLGHRQDPEKFNWNPVEYPYILPVCIFMNYPKVWVNHFEELQHLVKTHSNGRLELNIFPVYTAFKDFDLAYEGVNPLQQYSVVGRSKFNEYIKTHGFGNQKLTILSISKNDWKGKPFVGNDVEKGWFYLPTTAPGDTSHLPYKAFVVCDEEDRGFFYPEWSAFTESVYHELLHFLSYYGHPSKFDLTHTYHATRQIEKVLPEIDIGLLARNIS